MKKFLCFFIIIWGSLLSSGFSQIDSIFRERLQLWLKSDTGVVLNDTTVSRWIDQSGNGNDAIELTKSRQPVLADNVINGKPAIRFDGDRKSTRLNSSHLGISYAVFCLKKKHNTTHTHSSPPSWACGRSTAVSPHH